jgi:acyl-CoA dehydrogenase family member 9
LGQAFKDPIHSLGAIGEYLKGRAKRTITKPTFSRVHESLEREAGLVSTLVHDLALGVEAAVMKHGKGILEKQFLQERMANAAIDIFLATSVLSRTTWEIDRAERADGVGGSAADAHIDCARIFVPMAYRRARRSIRGLRRNQDARLKSLAERSLETGELGPEAPADER